MSIKVESGLQLLSRLTKRPRLEKFFPLIFGDGPKSGDFIEIYSEYSTKCLLTEIISQSLIPSELDGPGTGIVIFNTDGNLHIDDIINLTKKKISKYKIKNICTSFDLDKLLNSILKNIYIFNIYDETQFYISIHKLENLLMANTNIAMIVFDTLTAFYWCEQTFKITKMDWYIKKLLQVIQKVIKDFEVIVLYSRTENFSSSKEPIENLEACCQQSKDQLNYRIQIVYNEDGFNHVKIRTHNDQFTKHFKLVNDELCWL